MFNTISEHIHQVLGNIVRNFNVQQTYLDKNDLWADILDASEFANGSTTSRQKGYSPGQLIFGRDMILPIKHMVDWELIRQRKQTQINRDNSRENKYIVEYDHNIGYKSMLTDHTAYKY